MPYCIKKTMETVDQDIATVDRLKSDIKLISEKIRQMVDINQINETLQRFQNASPFVCNENLTTKRIIEGFFTEMMNYLRDQPKKYMINQKKYMINNKNNMIKTWKKIARNTTQKPIEEA